MFIEILIYQKNGQAQNIIKFYMIAMLMQNQVQYLEPTNIIRDKSDVLVADTKYGKVWYADEVTTKNWTKYINDKGYNVSIWRLGGTK